MRTDRNRDGCYALETRRKSAIRKMTVNKLFKTIFTTHSPRIPIMHISLSCFMFSMLFRCFLLRLFFSDCDLISRMLCCSIFLKYICHKLRIYIQFYIFILLLSRLLLFIFPKLLLLKLL